MRYLSPPLDHAPLEPKRNRIPEIFRHPESLAILAGFGLVALVVVALRWDQNVAYAGDLLTAFLAVGGEFLAALIPWIVMAIFVAIYFIPFIIGIKSPRSAAIFVANLVFGWTVIGWFAVLIWALAESGSTEAKQPPHR